MTDDDDDESSGLTLESHDGKTVEFAVEGDVFTVHMSLTLGGSEGRADGTIALWADLDTDQLQELRDYLNSLGPIVSNESS